MEFNGVEVEKCSFFDIQQKFAKDGNMSTKVGVTDPLKPQNPGKVVILAKSAIIAYKFSLVHMLDE